MIKTNKILSECYRTIVSHPKIIIPAIALFAWLWISSEYIQPISPYPSSFASESLYSLVPFFLLSLFILAGAVFFGGWLIALSAQAFSKKIYHREAAKTAFETWPNNFVCTLIVLAITILLSLAVHYASLYISLFFSFSLSFAQILFFILYVSMLVFILVFFVLTNFHCVINRYSIIKSISQSTFSVWRNYPVVLISLLSFFVLVQIIKFLPDLLADIVVVCIAFPILAILYSRIVLD